MEQHLGDWNLDGNDRGEDERVAMRSSRTSSLMTQKVGYIDHWEKNYTEIIVSKG